jgi:hypothetical protein
MVCLFCFVPFIPFRRSVPSIVQVVLIMNNEENNLIYFRGVEVRVSVSNMKRGARLVGDLDHS